MARVDAHVHVWRAVTEPTPGVTTLVPPQTDVPLAAVGEALAAHGIDRAVLVQPVFRGEDNSYVAACARQQPERFAAVAVVDPRVPGAEERLAHWVAQGVRGLRLRPLLAAEEAVFGDRATYPLWEAAEREQVVVSLLCAPRHLPGVAALAERFPAVSIVIDHMGHPDATAGAHAAAFQQLLALARYPRVWIKLSGFYHFSQRPFPFDDCRDLVAAVCDRFGPRRLLWGSDFPHVTVACGYARGLVLPAPLPANWDAADCERFWGGNALELYWQRQ